MEQSETIAIYIPSLTVGGAERVTVSVANGLANRGYNVDLIVSYNEGEFLRRVDESVNLVDLGSKRIPVIGISSSIPALVKYLNDNAPSVLLSQMTYANVICSISESLAATDTVHASTIHITLGKQEKPKSKFVEWLQKRLANRMDQFVAVSEGVAQSVIEQAEVSRQQVSVLHNPVPVADIRDEAQQSVDHSWINNPEYDVVLGVGRLTQQKNFELFLRAFVKVHDSQPQTRAIIVGQGPELDRLNSLAEELGIADVVSFPGYVDNVYGYMSGASVFTMSSNKEGLPTVLIEALACECQVVSTDCPSGPREILSDGTFGRLAPVGNADGLAKGILDALESPIQREELVYRARDFSLDRVIDEYEAFIQEMTEHTSKSGLGRTPDVTV